MGVCHAVMIRSGDRKGQGTSNDELGKGFSLNRSWTSKKLPRVTEKSVFLHPVGPGLQL